MPVGGSERVLIFSALAVVAVVAVVAVPNLADGGRHANGAALVASWHPTTEPTFLLLGGVECALLSWRIRHTLTRLPAVESRCFCPWSAHGLAVS
jgi:hypothetical protein